MWNSKSPERSNQRRHCVKGRGQNVKEGIMKLGVGDKVLVLGTYKKP